MNSVKEMVEALKANESVIALAEYGSAAYVDREIQGDYDLIVFVVPSIAGVESLHFFVDGTPVDLNLRSLEQIDAMPKAEGFESVLLDCRIIHDPSGTTRRALDGLRCRHEASSPSVISEEQIAGMRHGARHAFDKLGEGRNLPLVLKRYLLHQCVYWAVPQYFRIRSLQYRGEKHALAYLEEREPQLMRCIDRFYATTDTREQEELVGTIEKTVLGPIGGPWREEEVLVFGDQRPGQLAFRALFGDTVAA